MRNRKSETKVEKSRKAKAEVYIGRDREYTPLAILQLNQCGTNVTEHFNSSRNALVLTLTAETYNRKVPDLSNHLKRFFCISAICSQNA